MSALTIAALMVAGYAAVAAILYRVLSGAVRRRMPVPAALILYFIALYLAPSWLAQMALPGLHVSYAVLACYAVGIAALAFAIRGFRRIPVEPTVADRLSIWARLGYGLALPLAVFVVVQFMLIATNPRPDSWGGMGLFFASLLAFPILLAANVWVLVLRWRRRHAAFLAGMALPLTVMVPSALFALGTDFRLIIPLYSPWGVLYAVPLVAAIVVTRWLLPKAA